MEKIIYLGADHNGWQMKNELRLWLRDEGYKVVDLGPKEFDKSDDYPDYGFKVATAVATNPTNGLGILLCGSGAGMAVAAGKVAGVRAALMHDAKVARSARQDDDINVLALGAGFIDLVTAKEVIKAWLETDYLGEARHVRRLDKIRNYEQSQSQ
jgi:ribose 5-phosphate isomerase B